MSKNGLPFPWRWNSGTISAILDVIWGMSVHDHDLPDRSPSRKHLRFHLKRRRAKVFNTTTIQPVLPFQLTEEWKWIFRPVVPLHYWDAPSVSQGTPTQYPGGTIPVSVDFEYQYELGDIGQCQSKSA